MHSSKKLSALGLSLVFAGAACSAPAAPSQPAGEPASTLRADLLSDGLIAYWPFDEASGTSAADATGHLHTGTLASGAAFTAAGHNGGAVSFDGVNDRVNVAYRSDLNLWDQLTIAAWVFPTASSGWRTVLYREEPGGLLYSLYAFDSGHGPSGYIHPGVDVGVVGPSAIPLNAWTHLATTYDGHSLNIYVNGVLAASHAETRAMFSSTGALRIGGNAIAGEYFKGSIDEVRLYGRPLSAAEIGQLAGAASSPCDNVVCTASDQCHVAGTCDAQTGLCSNPAKANGSACSDGDACTQTDTCQTGACVGANPVVCSLPNAQSACVGGSCQFQFCDPGFFDCDGMPADGCEINVGTDPNNCGGCGHACAEPNATGTCNGGACGIGSCDAGFVDCDHQPNNGCEVNVASDPNNCGGCGHACAEPNATGTCNGGTCGVGSCNAGFADCDANAANGCETPLTNNTQNCGACGNQCPALPNATGACQSSTCGSGQCNSGFLDCDGSSADGCEVSVLTDSQNCGQCGHACNPAELCSSGGCVQTVTQRNFSFAPNELTISVGQTVTWNNIQGFHSVTADDGSYDSGVGVGNSSPPRSFSHTFASPGTYHYYCQVHGGPNGVGESGKVIVQ